MFNSQYSIKVLEYHTLEVNNSNKYILFNQIITNTYSTETYDNGSTFSRDGQGAVQVEQYWRGQGIAWNGPEYFVSFTILP